MKLWKTLFFILAIAGLTAVALGYMFKSDDASEFSKPDQPVWDARTYTANTGAYRPQIKLIGKVEPVQDITEVAMLSAQVIKIQRLDGTSANEGDLIIQLDDFEAQLQVKQLQADIANLDTQIRLQASQQRLDMQALEVEKANLKLLADRLVQQKAISQTQQALDDLKQQIQRQEFSVVQREAAVENHPANTQQLQIQKQKLQLALSSANRILDNTQVRAPFNGKIAQVLVKEGQRVNPGQALFRLYSEDKMSVQVQLPTRLLKNKEQLDGTAFQQNRISNISYSRSESQLNAGQSGFKAWFNLSSPEQWLPGDVVTLRMSLASTDSTLKIPAVSLFQDRWIYNVNDEQLLNAVEVDVLGSLIELEESFIIVKAKKENNSELRLLATRLNNPTTGMKIYEKGVDPEPLEEIEEELVDAEQEENTDNVEANDEDDK